MAHLGGFSEEALYLFQLAASERGYEEFSEEGGTYDFTRCVRSDGTAYGTKGACRKGSEQAKGPEEPKAGTSSGGTKPAGKPRATSAELKQSQAKLFDEAKARRAAAKEAEKAFKQVEKETKGDKSPEARKRRMEAGRAWDKASTAAERAQKAWMKEHERWSKAAGRDEKKKMTPAQRAEARRIDKIIKERG